MQLVALPNETESLSASSTSVNRSFGSDLETLSRCKQEIPVEPNLALRVLHAMRNGEMN